jgi:hypothetical protein
LEGLVTFHVLTRPWGEFKEFEEFKESEEFKG